MGLFSWLSSRSTSTLKCGGPLQFQGGPLCGFSLFQEAVRSTEERLPAPKYIPIGSQGVYRLQPQDEFGCVITCDPQLNDIHAAQYEWLEGDDLKQAREYGEVPRDVTL